MFPIASLYKAADRCQEKPTFLPVLNAAHLNRMDGRNRFENLFEVFDAFWYRDRPTLGRSNHPQITSGNPLHGLHFMKRYANFLQVGLPPQQVIRPDFKVVGISTPSQSALGSAWRPQHEVCHVSRHEQTVGPHRSRGCSVPCAQKDKYDRRDGYNQREGGR